MWKHLSEEKASDRYDLLTSIVTCLWRLSSVAYKTSSSPFATQVFLYWSSTSTASKTKATQNILIHEHTQDYQLTPLDNSDLPDSQWTQDIMAPGVLKILTALLLLIYTTQVMSILSSDIEVCLAV